METYTIAVLKGDGVGPEVIDATLQVLEAVEKSAGRFRLNCSFYPAGAGYYQQSGMNLSPQAFAACQSADAVLKGPMGLPNVRNPDGTEAGILGGVLRKGLDLYANVRPVYLFPGVSSALAGKKAGDINYTIVRENTEGIYFSRGQGESTADGVKDTIAITRTGTARIVRFAFELARKRLGAPCDHVRRVTCVDKSNVLRSFVLFRQVFQEVGAGYADIEQEYLYADAAAHALVLWPEHFDVIVCENFLGDVLSDLGAATAGGLGFCPGANLGEERAVFETAHGSAPSLAGKDKVNPVAAILAGAMLLEWLGEEEGGKRIVTAIESVFRNGTVHIDRDGCPVEGTRRVVEAVIRRIQELS